MITVHISGVGCISRIVKLVLYEEAKLPMTTLDRRVGFFEGLRYRGASGMFSWMLHRVTGLGILVFVGIHVLAGFFGQQFGSDLAFAVNAVYEAWPFQIFVYFSILFHAFNGTRVALMDLFPGLLRYQREMLWLQWIVFVPFFVLPSFVMVQNTLSGAA